MRKITDMTARTPTERVGDCWAKRDDYFYSNGARGGKCRAAKKICSMSSGVVTYGSRTSPQGAYTAAAAADVGVPCIYVCPHGETTPEIEYVKMKKAKVVRAKPGYLSQCASVAKRTAESEGYDFVKLSMESNVALDSTRDQVEGSIPKGAQRIVIVVGGGISAAALLWGLQDIGLKIPVLGVRIGRDPAKQLDFWCPDGWARSMELVTPSEGYNVAVPNVWQGITVDPYYEAKCIPYLQPGDLFWIVGIRPVIDGKLID